MKTRYIFFTVVLFACGLIAAVATLGITTFLSPRNHTRPFLRKVEYIVLHNTIAPKKSALAKLRRNGEAHYFVDKEGQIYQLIQDNRVAYHAGKSMWHGRMAVDNFTIGIEIEGLHTELPTSAQEKSLTALLGDLKSKFKVTDDRVVTHSMVAYGVPNPWHERNHRGRKKCGMLLQDPAVRIRLGLFSRAEKDVDVESNRLTRGDETLFAFLYGNKPSLLHPEQSAQIIQAINQADSEPDANIVSKERSAWFIARSNYNKATTLYTFPDGSKITGDRVLNWSAIQPGTKVTTIEEDSAIESKNFESDAEVVTRADFKEIGKDGRTAFQIARREYASERTIYFFPDGRVLDGRDLYNNNRYLLTHLPLKTKIILGYISAGEITRQRLPFSISKSRWNSPTTIYRYANGQVITGDEIKAAAIPIGTYMFFEQ